MTMSSVSLKWIPATSTKKTIAREDCCCWELELQVYSLQLPFLLKEFDFKGHDSAFKDRFLQLQNVVYNLVNHVYDAPNQMVNILDMQERTTDGKNYYTYEYELTSPNYASSSFATIAIGNGKESNFLKREFLLYLYYTQVVGALERRWSSVRNKLKVVADSFKVLDI
ncbi:hypothetical protein CRYUN_Cryun09bG0093600 [Craigia yunnanensis]